MIIKDFQPIHLRFCDDDTACKCGQKGCDQRALLTDHVSFQFEDIEQFTLPELLVEAGDNSWYGDFHDAAAFNNNWSNTALGGQAWTWNAGGFAQVTLADGQESEILHTDTSFTFTACHSYRIRFAITPDYGDDCDFEIYLRNPVGPATTLIKTYEAPEVGTYEFVYTPDVTVIRQLGFKVAGDCEGEGENTTYTLDNVSLKEIEKEIKIIDCCTDTIIDSIDYCDIIVDEDDGYANVQFKWEDYVIDNSCYKICIDDVNLIQGGTFETILDEQKWSQEVSGIDWLRGQPGLATSNLMYADLGVGEETKVLTYGLTSPYLLGLPPNCTYRLSFEAIPTAIFVTDWEVDLYINEELHITWNHLAVPAFYDINIDVQLDSIGFRARDLRAGGVGDIQVGIDNVAIIHDICSDCICVRDNHDCTHLIKAWNDEDSEDFYFPDDFFFYMRVKSKFRNYRYPTNEEIYLSSHGENTLQYRRSEKIWDFQFERMPEYMHDACTTLFGLDNLQVDGIDYIKVAGDIEPIHNRNNDYLSSLTIEVKKKIENRVK